METDNLVLAVPVHERLERAAKLGRQIVFFDRAEKRDRRLVGFQLCDAAWAGGEMAFEIRVDSGRQVTLDEIREKPDEIVAATFLRHGQ